MTAPAPTPGTVITLAPTGAETEKSAAAALPVSLEELLSDAKAASAEGAAVIHVHVRDHAAQPSLDPAILAETVTALREGTDLIVQLSSGGAVTDPEDDRLAVLDALPEMASCTMGTVNFGDDVFLNRWGFIVELHQRARERKVLLEYELFDLGHATSLKRLLDRHGAPHTGRVHCDIVLGVPGGLPATPAGAAVGGGRAPPGRDLVGHRHRPRIAAHHADNACGRRPSAGWPRGHPADA